MNFRTYFDVEGKDRSGLGEQVGDHVKRVRDRMANVRRIILVASGKGGVGKSHVAASIALELAYERGCRVGVLDADLASPTVARLLGASDRLHVTKNGVVPVSCKSGVKVISTDLLLDEGQPLQWTEPDEARFAWRGAMQAGVLREFLSDVVWGDLDALIVDAPPGTAVMNDLHELVPDVTGAVFVTIPSVESARSVARTMRAALEEGVPLLGIIENMSGFVCDSCGGRRPLFPGTAGSDLAAEFGVPLLAEIPFGPSAGRQTVLPSMLLDALLENER